MCRPKVIFQCILAVILLSSCVETKQLAITPSSMLPAEETPTIPTIIEETPTLPADTPVIAYPVEPVSTETMFPYPAPSIETASPEPKDIIRPSWTPTITPIPRATPEMTLTPPAITGQIHLPAPLYYLYPPDWNNPDTQIWRLEQDGKKRSQVTHEAKRVRAFDVARDGKLAYITDNDLIVTDKNGGNRKILIAGGKYPEMKTADDLPNNLLNAVERPVWSPNGQSLAVGWNGVKVIDIKTGKQIQVTPENNYKNGVVSYCPLTWSPSGNLLAISIGYYEGSEVGITQPEPNATIILPRNPGLHPFGNRFTFLSDGRLLFGNHVYVLPPDTNSLWIVNIQSMRDRKPEVIPLKIKTDNPEEKYIFNAPKEAANGRIYFFTYLLNPQEQPLAQMAWINPSQAVESLEIHRVGSFGIDPDKLDSIVWSPDGSMAVLPIHQENLVVIRTSDGEAFQIDVPSGADLRWGPD